MPSLNVLNVYVVKPKEAVNLVTNPSFEKATTGYTAVSSTIARTNAEQRRGAYSLEITPTTGVESGVYFGTVPLVSGTTYTFSVDVKGVAGQAMRLQVRNTSGVAVGSQTFTATGYWQRVSFAYPSTITTSRRLYVVRDAVASTDKIYVDGFQMEAGAESTYFDGDMKGYARNRVDFRWMGVAHQSPSWRSATTRKGGELVNLKTLCNVLGVIGLGMAQVSPQALDTTLPGSLYQRTSIEDRDFSIPVLFSGDNFQEIMQDRKSVIDLIRPDAGADDQPITLVMEAVNNLSVAVTERVVVAAHYVGGLEMKITNQRAEKATLSFRSYLPFIMSEGSRSTTLLNSTPLTANSIIARRSNGAWENAGQVASISSGTGIRAIVRGPDGYIYFGGGFENFNGDANIDYVGKTDGNGTFLPLGTGISGSIISDSVQVIAIGPDGKVYVAGLFTASGGVAGTAYIAAWNGAIWEAVVTVDGPVRDMVFTDDGALFIIGAFTTVDGVACSQIARRSPAGTWGAVGTGITEVGRQIYKIIAIGNDVYIGGYFSLISGVTANSMAKYSGGAWTAVGTGTSGSSSPSVGYISVVGMAYDKKTNRIYIGGPFDKFNGVTAEGVGYWTGTQFVAMATNLGTNTSWDVNKSVYVDADGGVYIWCGTQYLNGVLFSSRMIYFFANQLHNAPIGFTDATYLIASLFVDENNNEVYFGLSKLTSTTVNVPSVSVDSLSTSRSNPVFTIIGPGTLYGISNGASEQQIEFAGLTLVAGEVATLDLTPGQGSFSSNFRGNMMRYIVPGSNLDLFLQTGVNNVSAFMTDTTSASQILMTWQDTYWSLDGAVR